MILFSTSTTSDYFVMARIDQHILHIWVRFVDERLCEEALKQTLTDDMADGRWALKDLRSVLEMVGGAR